MTGSFYDDLNRELADPEVAAEFAANQARIRTFDAAVNAQLAAADELTRMDEELVDADD